MEVDGNAAIPVQAILKLIVDRSGSQEVEDALKKQDQAFTKVEETVQRIGTHMSGIGKTVGELVGVTGLSAVVDKFLKIETSASNIALAMGKVTGGSSVYGGIRQEELGVQKNTGVSPAEQESALRSLAMSVGLNPKPGQAGMLAEVIAGYSRVTGISTASLGSILGPMLQAEGRGSSPGAAAFTLGEARANLTAFPGSQIEGMLPVVSNLSTTAALGAMPRGKAADVSGISAMINTIAGSNSPLRQPGVAEAAAQGIGGTLQGAWRNPQTYAFLKMAGIGYWESQEGFNKPATMEKLIREANRLYPGEHNKQLRNMLYQELGGGQAGADAIEQIERATHGGTVPLHVHTPQMHKEARERRHAQTLTTPEAQLQKAQGGILGWLFESPEHAAIGAGGALLGGKLLKGGLSKLGDLLKGGEAAGEDAGGAAIGAGGLALGLGAGVLEGLFNRNPLGFLGLSNPTGGDLSGNATGTHRQQLEAHANANAVEAVARAAQKKFGAHWRSPTGQRWMETQLNDPHSSYNQMTRAGIGESITGPHPWAATHLLQQALKAEQAGNEGAGQGGSSGSFSDSVKKFSEAVEKLTRAVSPHHAGYEGGATARNAAFAGAPAVAAMQAVNPGAIMAAFLQGPGTTPQGAGGPTTTTAAFTSPGGGGAGGTSSSGWNSVLKSYSGGSYGLDYVLKLAHEHPGGGAHRGDRATVAADAKKYGIPFDVLWGIYGAESSFGKAASNFGLTGQFPGTGTSGSFGTDARMSAQDLAALVKQMHLNVHVHVGSKKVEQHRTLIGGQTPVTV